MAKIGRHPDRRGGGCDIEVNIMNTDIEHAVASLRINASRFAKAERYYNGEHDLAFATEKFENTFGTLFREFALNLCPVICDAVRDKLRVTGFGLEAVDTNDADREMADGGALISAARRIWQTNRMGTRAGEIHKEALKCGDAYMIVWPNAHGEIVLYPNRAANVTVVYDEDSPGHIASAAKAWRTAEKYVRLNLFYPDRIERYISKKEVEGSLPDASEFTPFGGEADPHAKQARVLPIGNKQAFTENAAESRTAFQVPNPFGVVPVFHFSNNADLGMTGRSELDAAIPVQDGLNKSVLDMLVAMEFSAFRQRWAAGIEVEYDADGKAMGPFMSGVEHLWVAGNADAKFGDFEAAQLDQFLKVKDSFRIDMASVTGTPLHYFLQTTGGLPSGESLKKAETRFLSKVRDRQESFGQVWADVMGLALRMEGIGSGIRLLTEWEDPAPMSDKEFLENILLKKQIGLPVKQALIEAGYGEADVKTMLNAPDQNREQKRRIS